MFTTSPLPLPPPPLPPPPPLLPLLRESVASLATPFSPPTPGHPLTVLGEHPCRPIAPLNTPAPTLNTCRHSWFTRTHGPGSLPWILAGPPGPREYHRTYPPDWEIERVSSTVVFTSAVEIVTESPAFLALEHTKRAPSHPCQKFILCCLLYT